MGQMIIPDKQTVQTCLKDKTYYVDFYQREYVWNDNTVKILLNDIFEVFENSYSLCADAELTREAMDNAFSWYYLNVFITNKVDGKTYIVDGQQRLSTLTLICTKLYHLTKENFAKELLLPCICGKDWDKSIYRIDNDKRKDAMDSVLNGTAFEGGFKNKTEETIINNYKYISDYFDKKNLDDKKLRAFIYYFLNKLVLVELSIEKQDDTSMIFEVINDRGEALKPFEILKGKLIGVLNKSDTDIYSAKWDSSMHLVETMEDVFFATYLKSRFINSRNSEKEKRINNAYHRYIFEQNSDADVLGFRKTDENYRDSIKKFIENDVVYYAALFSKIVKNNDKFLSYSNDIHKLDGQYQLILSACSINDSEENEKITTIAKEYDRFHMILRMNGLYDSNDFHNLSYSLNEKIKGLPLSEYRQLFNNVLKNYIMEKRHLENVNSVLDFSRFSQIGYNTNIDQTALYYLFARIEELLNSKLDNAKKIDVHWISTKHSNVNGFHIEHIFSNNEENISFFGEDEFWTKRNNIGGLLVLQGRSNISSGNETFSDKLKTYSHGSIFAQTLCEDFYHANPSFNDFNNLLKSKGVEFKYYNEFKPENMEERCKLIYELVKIIWEI